LLHKKLTDVLQLRYSTSVAGLPFVCNESTVASISGQGVRGKLFAQIISLVSKLSAYKIWGIQCKGNIQI